MFDINMFDRAILVPHLAVYEVNLNFYWFDSFKRGGVCATSIPSRSDPFAISHLVFDPSVCRKAPVPTNPIPNLRSQHNFAVVVSRSQIMPKHLFSVASIRIIVYWNIPKVYIRVWLQHVRRMNVKSNKRGKKSNTTIRELIKEYPGLSQYELSRKLRWTTGRVDGAVRRLVKSGEVFLRVVVRNGRGVNLVYPEEFKPSDNIEVPNNLLDIGNPVWQDRAWFYALDSSTIGISGYNIDEWNEISQFVEEIPIDRSREEEKLVLRIPERFWTFYNLERKHRVVSINGNAILVTLSGDIIEERAYPS